MSQAGPQSTACAPGLLQQCRRGLITANEDLQLSSFGPHSLPVQLLLAQQLLLLPLACLLHVPATSYTCCILEPVSVCRMSLAPSTSGGPLAGACS